MEQIAEMISKKEELYQRRKKLVPNGLGIFNPSSVQYAHGATMIDADGRELIDFAGGIGVLNAGHCPPPVVKAIQEQAERIEIAGTHRGPAVVDGGHLAVQFLAWSDGSSHGGHAA